MRPAPNCRCGSESHGGTESCLYQTAVALLLIFILHSTSSCADMSYTCCHANLCCSCWLTTILVCLPYRTGTYISNMIWHLAGHQACIISLGLTPKATAAPRPPPSHSTTRITTTTCCYGQRPLRARLGQGSGFPLLLLPLPLLLYVLRTMQDDELQPVASVLQDPLRTGNDLAGTVLPLWGHWWTQRQQVIHTHGPAAPARRIDTKTPPANTGAGSHAEKNEGRPAINTLDAQIH